MEKTQDKIIQGLRFITTPKAFITLLVLIIILVFISPVILLTYAFWDFGKSSDTPIIVKVKISSDKNLTARHYRVSGGGAAGYVWEIVNIQPSADVFDKSKGVVLQISHSEVPSLDWKDNYTLVVEYLRTEEISLKREALENMNIKVLFIER